MNIFKQYLMLPPCALITCEHTFGHVPSTHNCFWSPDILTHWGVYCLTVFHGLYAFTLLAHVLLIQSGRAVYPWFFNSSSDKWHEHAIRFSLDTSFPSLKLDLLLHFLQ